MVYFIKSIGAMHEFKKTPIHNVLPPHAWHRFVDHGGGLFYSMVTKYPHHLGY